LSFGTACAKLIFRRDMTGFSVIMARINVPPGNLVAPAAAYRGGRQVKFFRSDPEVPA
jgi:hypothetical protein